MNNPFNIGVAPITQVTHMHNKNSNIQGRSHNVVKVIWMSYYKELLLKDRIRFLWEQILSFKRSSHFEKGRKWTESLLTQYPPFDVRNFFLRSGYAIV